MDCNNYLKALVALPSLETITEQHDAKTHDDHVYLFSIIPD